MENHHDPLEGLPADVAHNQAYTNILTRSSVRTYTPEPVSDDTLRLLMRAGMAAPTGVNAQPWQFVAVTDPELRSRLARQLPYAHMLADAPAAIVVCGDMSLALHKPDTELWIQDTSAATENILLAAHALGLGAVWTAVYPYPERIGTVRRELLLPDHVIPLNVIVLGHPAHQLHVMDKYKTGRIHFNHY